MIWTLSIFRRDDDECVGIYDIALDAVAVRDILGLEEDAEWAGEVEAPARVLERLSSYVDLPGDRPSFRYFLGPSADAHHSL